MGRTESRINRLIENTERAVAELEEALGLLGAGESVRHQAIDLAVSGLRENLWMLERMRRKWSETLDEILWTK